MTREFKGKQGTYTLESNYKDHILGHRGRVYCDCKRYKGNGDPLGFFEKDGQMMCLLFPIGYPQCSDELGKDVIVPADILIPVYGSSCMFCKLNWSKELRVSAGNPSAPVHTGAGTYLSICPKCGMNLMASRNLSPEYREATAEDIRT